MIGTEETSITQRICSEQYDMFTNDTEERILDWLDKMDIKPACPTWKMDNFFQDKRAKVLHSLSIRSNKGSNPSSISGAQPNQEIEDSIRMRGNSNYCPSFSSPVSNTLHKSKSNLVESVKLEPIHFARTPQSSNTNKWIDPNISSFSSFMKPSSLLNRRRLESLDPIDIGAPDNSELHGEFKREKNPISSKKRTEDSCSGPYKMKINGNSLTRSTINSMNTLTSEEKGSLPFESSSKLEDIMEMAQADHDQISIISNEPSPERQKKETEAKSPYWRRGDDNSEEIRNSAAVSHENEMKLIKDKDEAHL